MRDDHALLEYHRSGSVHAREEAIEQYIPLARRLARRYARRGEPIEDLEQVACLALVRAVDAFDPSHGTAFSSYAVPCLTGALKRHFRDTGWAVRVPRALQELALRVNHVTEELTTATGHAPTLARVAEEAGVDVEDVLGAREAFTALHAESIHQPRRTGEDGGLTLLETLPDGDAELTRAFHRVVLEELLEGLGERERTVIDLYYRDELTQAEIGRRIGYSQMHISRLLRRAERKLQLTAAAA